MNSLASGYIKITIKQSFKGLTGHWSKYGGAKQEIYVGKGNHKKLDDIWVCQSCAKQQPKELTLYLFEYPENEYIRICWECKIENALELLNRI